MRSLKAAMNWAVKNELIERHSLAAVETRAKGSRGEEAYIGADVYKRVAEKSNANFRDLLWLMRDTGCRPDEAYQVEARYYHKADKCIIYPGEPKPGDYCWKNAKKNRKRVDRLIYLTDELAAMIEARIAKYPTGRLFRTTRGKPWGREAVGIQLRWISKKLKLARIPTAYGLRHAYATDFLLAGGSIKILADLIGTSVAMIERHYGHVQVDRPRMRSIMLTVMAGRHGSQSVPVS